MRCRKVDEQKTRETLVTMAALFAGIGLAGVLAGAMIAGPLLCGAAFGVAMAEAARRAIVAASPEAHREDLP